MEDAAFDYNILKRPLKVPKSETCEESGDDCTLKAEDTTTAPEKLQNFKDELQAYEDSKTREESAGDWLYDANSGYYYNASKNTYAIWNSEANDWTYFDYNNAQFENSGKETSNGESENPKEESCELPETIATKDNVSEEGQLSETEEFTASSSTHDYNNAEQNSLYYQPPSSYIPTEDIRYFFNPETNIWFDAETGVYSVYDASTNTYIPVDLTAPIYASPSVNNEDSTFDDQGEPGSDATLRLVVLKSEILKPGNLVIVDGNGISIGRDRWNDRRLRLPELRTSKHHCQIFCSSAVPLSVEESNLTATNGDDDCDDAEGTALVPTSTLKDTFHIIDSGSQNGTFVNSNRLSESKKSSKPQILAHLDEIVIGSTTFQVHLHQQWTCEACTVSEGKVIKISHSDNNISGLSTKQSKDREKIATDLLISKFGNTINTTNNNNAITISSQRELLELQRRQELSRLKRKYIGNNNSDSNHNAKQTKYIDRAALRREIRPDNSPVKKQRDDLEDDDVSFQAPHNGRIGSENKGNLLLQKMGWKEGQGLGKTGEGIVNPVDVFTNDGRRGLGFGPGGAKKTILEGNLGMGNSKETLQEATRRIARERFMDMFE